MIPSKLKQLLIFAVCFPIGVQSQAGITISQRNLEKAAAKCRDYSSPLNKNFELLPLVAGAAPQIITIPVCDQAGEQLIVGGQPARDGEFPHMAAAGFQDQEGNIQWLCGGTLISERYVLTAAHCLYHQHFGQIKKIRLGTNIITVANFNHDYNVESVIRYPNYSRRTKYNDIGLIRLDRDVQISKQVRPACLFTEENVNSRNAIASGWGRKEHGGDASDQLLKVGLELYPNRDCEVKYSNVLRNGVTNTMLCAGYQAGGKDTCQGDSGGPLMITSESNACIYYVIGVTSFGKYCGGANLPSVYTRVSAYTDWIADNIW